MASASCIAYYIHESKVASYELTPFMNGVLLVGNNNIT